MKKLFRDILTSDGKKISLGRVSFCIAFIISMIMYVLNGVISASMITLLGLLLGYGTLSKVPGIKRG